MSNNTTENSVSQVELQNPPSDGISKVRFANTNNLLAVSSWDKTVRYYDPVSDLLKHTWDMPAAILDVCWSSDDKTIGSGGLTTQFVLHDLETTGERVLGKHNHAISCVEHSQNLWYTGSWDCTIAMWDDRKPSPELQRASTGGNKVFSMSTSDQYVVVGTADRKVYVFDNRKIDQPLQDRESSLKHQTRDIQVNTEQTGYLLTSVEGRVAIEYFDPSPDAQARKFAFKCHRYLDKETQSATVFPVNCAAFHPRFGTFVTGGCDGLVNVWDGNNKKRICQFPQYTTSIASVDFNLNGRYLAVATSYTWEQGEKVDAPADSICIRNIREFEVQPKKKR